jgi:MFS transporter, DHA3 family, macrolide efflux protein
VTASTKRISGFPGFTVLWSGQVLSAVGTRMTNFALSIWVWQQTKSAFALSLMLFCAFGATMLASPIAGRLVDRWNRRVTIVLSDVASAVTTLGLVALFLGGGVQVWHLYVINALTGAFLAVQGPAYAATISVMVDKSRYSKANAMMSMVRSMPAILAPGAAAALLGVFGLNTVLVIDFASYLLAIATVFLVALPPVPPPAGDDDAGFWSDAAFGFRYLAGNRVLAWFEGFTLVMSVFAAIGFALLAPTVLARSGGSDTALATTQTFAAVGGVAGGFILTALKDTRRKMLRLLLALVVFSVVGRILFGAGDTLVIWSIAMFATHFCLPFMDGYTQSIWQEKVPPAVQGRVFAARGFIEGLAIPIGVIVAGPLADDVFEPAMRPGGGLASNAGAVLGTGPGSGMALMCVGIGVLTVAAAAVAYAVPTLRKVETLIPDHDAEPGPGEPADEALPALAG